MQQVTFRKNNFPLLAHRSIFSSYMYQICNVKSDMLAAEAESRNLKLLSEKNSRLAFGFKATNLFFIMHNDKATSGNEGGGGLKKNSKELILLFAFASNNSKYLCSQEQILCIDGAAWAYHQGPIG